MGTDQSCLLLLRLLLPLIPLRILYSEYEALVRYVQGRMPRVICKCVSVYDSRYWDECTAMYARSVHDGVLMKSRGPIIWAEEIFTLVLVYV